MKRLVKIKEILIKEKENLLSNYGIRQIGLFGSYIRGEEKAESDIDILIDIEKPLRIDLIKLIEIEQDLSEKLDAKVDLAIKEDLKPRIGKHILKEVVYL